MLRHLRVTNFAILSDVEVELGGGMNVLTGETGAGKSLIVEAVNLLRGGRASRACSRARGCRPRARKCSSVASSSAVGAVAATSTVR